MKTIQKAYVFKVAKHILLYEQQQNCAEAQHDFTGKILQGVGFNHPEIDSQLMHRIFNELPDESRHLLRLLYLEDKSPDEVRDLMGFSSSEVVLKRKSELKQEVVRHLFQIDRSDYQAF